MGLKGKTYHLGNDLLERPIAVSVVGAGGSGSHMIAQLAVLHQSMLDLGHPFGLDVTVYDPDLVSQANVGRAKFYESDVGVHKSLAVVNRVNLCFGLDWKASIEPFGQQRQARDGLYPQWAGHGPACDILIGCVDTRSSRRDIVRALSERHRGVLWLDLGNGEFDGQVVLGELGGHADEPRLPCVTDLFPELLDASRDPATTGPSCSRREALLKQSAFVNAAAALHAVSLLSTLVRFGRVDYHAIFFDVSKGRATRLMCDPAEWRRFGWEQPAVAQALDEAFEPA